MQFISILKDQRCDLASYSYNVSQSVSHRIKNVMNYPTPTTKYLLMPAKSPNPVPGISSSKSGYWVVTLTT